MKKTIKLPYWNHNTAYFPWILKHLPAGAQILDVGCGDGTLVYYLSDSVTEAVGLDPYAACIEDSVKKYGTVANIHFICSSFEEFDAEDQYDVIIFSASLHHMNMTEAIRKAKILLRENGVLLIVGLASPAGLADYILEGIRLLPSAILSRLHRMKTSEEIGVPTSYEMSSMKEIRKIVNAELPGAHIRYGLYYRYLLNWRKMSNEIFKDIESTLTGLIGDLKPAPAEPAESKLTESVYFDYSEKDNTHFLALLTDALKNAKTFEIHCWNEETEEIALALKYGKLNESDWTYGKIITGEITAEFTEMILAQPKPTDIEAANKMTPFWGIFLDDTFQSSHWGCEIYYGG